MINEEFITWFEKKAMWCIKEKYNDDYIIIIERKKYNIRYGIYLTNLDISEYNDNIREYLCYRIVNARRDINNYIKNLDNTN